jgi:transcriptional regulator with XRE-family HTH domain
MQYNNIASRLKTLRKQLKLSQTDFGKKIGKNYHTVMRWELEKVLPPSNVLMHIAETFNVNPEWLLEGEGKPFSEKNVAAEKKSEYIADCTESNIKLPKGVRKVKSDKLSITINPPYEAIYAPASSSPPVMENDILIISKNQNTQNEGLCLIIDKYNDTHVRWFYKNEEIIKSKRPDYPDLKASESMIIGFVAKILREIQPYR